MHARTQISNYNYVVNKKNTSFRFEPDFSMVFIIEAFNLF